MKKLVLGVVLLVFLFTLVGCGGISIPTEDGGKMNFSKDGLTIEGEDGSTGKITTDKEGGMTFESDDGGELKFGENLDLPEGYPEDILPLYKKESILSTSTADGSYYVMYISKASIEDGIEYYNGLVEGLEENTVTTSDTGAMIFANIDGRECAIMINEDSDNENKANISLTIGSEQE